MQRIERTSLDERLDDAAVDALSIDARAMPKLFSVTPSFRYAIASA